jgi:AraC family transcriptional regulator
LLPSQNNVRADTGKGEVGITLPALDGVRALSSATHTEPLARAKHADTDICTWAIGPDSYEHEAVPDILIGLLTDGDVAWRSAALGRHGIFRHGFAAVIPAGTRLRMAPARPLTATTLHISPERANCIFAIDDGSRLLTQASLRIGWNNPLVSSSLAALADEIRQPSMKGSLFLDSVIALVLHQALYAPSGDGNLAEQKRLSATTLRVIENHVRDRLDEPIGLQDLSQMAGLSQFHFSKVFKAQTGLTPHQYVVRERIARAKTLLSDRQRSITEIALAVGFSSHSHFSSVFRAYVGVPPRTFRQSR